MFGREKMYKRGMGDAMNAYQAFGEKQEEALAKIREEVQSGKVRLEDALSELGSNVNGIYDYLDSKEKSYLYHLDSTPIDIKNLDEKEQQLLLAILYQLGDNEGDRLNESQRSYIRSVQKYLGITNPQITAHLEDVENIDSIEVQKVFLQMALEFFYLQEGDNLTVEQEEFLGYFSVNQKQSQQIELNVSKLFSIVGPAGIAEKYGYVPEEEHQATEKTAVEENDEYIPPQFEIPISKSLADEINVGWYLETEHYVLSHERDFYKDGKIEIIRTEKATGIKAFLTLSNYFPNMSTDFNWSGSNDIILVKVSRKEGNPSWILYDLAGAQQIEDLPISAEKLIRCRDWLIFEEQVDRNKYLAAWNLSTKEWLRPEDDAGNRISVNGYTAVEQTQELFFIAYNSEKLSCQSKVNGIHGRSLFSFSPNDKQLSYKCNMDDYGVRKICALNRDLYFFTDEYQDSGNKISLYKIDWKSTYTGPIKLLSFNVCDFLSTDADFCLDLFLYVEENSRFPLQAYSLLTRETVKLAEKCGVHEEFRAHILSPLKTKIDKAGKFQRIGNLVYYTQPGVGISPTCIYCVSLDQPMQPTLIKKVDSLGKTVL